MPMLPPSSNPGTTRAERSLEGNKDAYTRMVAFGEELAQAGLLSVNSLSSNQKRLNMANGQRW